jgi:Flp pilus assembly pilin Flp
MRALIRRLHRGESGSVTAEYAVLIVATVSFAVIMFKLLNGPVVAHQLSAVVVSALQVNL